MLSEREYVIRQFKKNFDKYKHQNMAIYGLGKNTKVLLDEYYDYHILALMDEIKEGEEIWKLPVVSCKQAYEMGVSVILILARAANVPIIYRRIEQECTKYGISVYDINGNDLNCLKKNKKCYVCPNEYSENTYEVLKRKIEECDVVSFDIFDTLLMRKVLYPTDVFYLVEKKAKNEGILQEDCDFYKIRIKAERELYLKTNPTIYDIYEKISCGGKISSEISAQLLSMEIEEEKEQLIAREEMKEIVLEAINQGKIVCCTSDMYLQGSILRKILEQNGYTGIEKLFVSCDYGVSKCNGLFEYVRRAYPNKRILHVGDNDEVDILMPFQYGIDDAFHINSAFRMFTDSAIHEVITYTGSIDNRIFIGNFVSGCFRNPFLFQKTCGKCCIDSEYRLGHDFIAPIVISFVLWMIKKIEEHNISIIFLGARDGWIVKQLLDIISEKRQLAFQYHYIYTSRMACTLAGMETEEDVAYAGSLAFSGTVERMLQVRFLLREDEIRERKKNETDEQYLQRHSEIILKHAKEYKSNFLEYILKEKIDLLNQKDVAFFDFVSSGTCHMWLEKILGKRMKGFYFIRIFDPHKMHLDVEALFEQACVYEREECKMMGNYFFMENVMSSTEPTVSYIGKEGELHFKEEHRTRKQIEEMETIQYGIIDAFRSYISQNPMFEILPELADAIIGLIHEKYTKIDIDYFEKSMLKDEFCNREFELNTMIKEE